MVKQLENAIETFKNKLEHFRQQEWNNNRELKRLKQESAYQEEVNDKNRTKMEKLQTFAKKMQQINLALGGTDVGVMDLDSLLKDSL